MKIFMSTSMPVIMLGDYTPSRMQSLEARKQLLDEVWPKTVPYMRVGNVEVRVIAGVDGSKLFLSKALDVEDVLYYMRLQPIKLELALSIHGWIPKEFYESPKPHGVYQGSVWTNPNMQFQKGTIARQVYWRVFAEKGIIYSDTQQSSDGKRFWANRIIDALNSNRLSVYAVRIQYCSDHDYGFIHKIVPIKSPVEADRHPYFSYEEHKDDEGLNWRFCIIKN